MGIKRNKTQCVQKEIDFNTEQLCIIEKNSNDKTNPNFQYDTVSLSSLEDYQDHSYYFEDNLSMGVEDESKINWNGSIDFQLESVIHAFENVHINKQNVFSNTYVSNIAPPQEIQRCHTKKSQTKINLQNLTLEIEDISKKLTRNSISKNLVGKSSKIQDITSRVVSIQKSSCDKPKYFCFNFRRKRIVFDLIDDEKGKNSNRKSSYKQKRYRSKRFRK